MLVKESINFERGQDPIKAMKIGNIEFIKSLNWGQNVDIETVLSHNNNVFLETYKDFKLLTVKVNYDFKTKFITITSPPIMEYQQENFSDTPEKAKEFIMKRIDRCKN